MKIAVPNSKEPFCPDNIIFGEKLAKGIRSTVWTIKGWEGLLIAKVISVNNNDDIREEIPKPDDINNNNIYNTLRIYRKERNILKTLDNCKGTLKVIHSIEDDKSLILICYPRCYGGSLYSVAIGRYPMTEDLLRSLVFAIIKIVEDIHQEQIIHGCIRAEHILLLEKWSCNNRPKLVLIDFGNSNHNNSVYENPSHQLSLHYTAPELLSKVTSKDNLCYTPKLDWWAVGVTLYLMVYGKYPFDSLQRRDLIHKIVNLEPVYRSGPPPGLITIIKGLLRKTPQIRYGAEELLSNSWLR